MIVDPDAEQLVINYLATQLPLHGFAVDVADRVPQTNSESVTVIRTGGVRRDLVTDQAQLSIDVRAAKNSRAVEIIQMVRALLNDLWASQIEGFQVYDVNELSGPYSNPTGTDWCRYSQNFIVAIRSKNVA